MTDFDDARRAALMSDLVRSLRNLPRDLLPFEEVREKLRLRHMIDRGIVDVPLDSIVGSLGRDREFTREFLPRDEALRERWEDLREIAEGPAGFPSVDLCKVGDAYFVLDGHHRVSVARALGAQDIEASVREFITDIPIEPEDSIEEIVLRRGRADFLEATGLDAADGEFAVTEIDGYQRLLDHISTHRYFLGIDKGGCASWDEAVASWRDHVYGPAVALIRERRVLDSFPGRTEADLYLYAMDHLHFLREREGSDAEALDAVEEMRKAQSLSERLRRFWRGVMREEGTA